MVTTGLALFSMFFGAGNLIFPMLIGKEVGPHSWFAILGLGITAVIVPFLGLAAMILFEGSIHRFFGRLGKIPGMMLLFLLQFILGPLGVIPRLLTLMHGTAKPYIWDTPLAVFTLGAALLVFVFSFKKEALIHVVGSILSPIKLLSLSLLIVIGLSGISSLSSSSSTPIESFSKGLLGGYNTMDLIAAFLFATVVLPFFYKAIQGEPPQQKRRSLIALMLGSSLIAATLLFLAYMGLMWISAYHAPHLSADLAPQELLGAIAYRVLGPIGGSIAAFAVVMACLTTAVTLSSIFANYLQNDLCKGKIGYTPALIATLLLTVLMANLGFGGILAFLSPILQVIYPGLILFSILNLLHSLYGFQMVKTPVFISFIIALIASI